MKKFLAIFAAAAIVATAGFAVVHNKMNDENVETETTSEAQSYNSTDYYSGNDYSATSESIEAQTSESSVSETSSVAEAHSFTSQIDSLSGTMLIVLPDKNCSEYNSSDKIALSIDGISLVDENGKSVQYDDVKNFESAKVVYSGDIKETYPAQVDAQKVVLSGRRYCTVSFVVDGKVIKTHRVEKGGSLNAADMPNAGAYCKDGYHFECWLNGDKSVSSVSDISDNITLTAKISKD